MSKYSSLLKIRKSALLNSTDSEGFYTNISYKESRIWQQFKKGIDFETSHDRLMDWIKKVRSLPTGHSEVYYLGKRYGLSKTEFNAGRCIKIYAEELGGSHFISFNCYYTVRSVLLKPCEMPEKDVIHFLEHIKFNRE